MTTKTTETHKIGTHEQYLAFLETVSTLRPSLHRYCARMTGSILDGEDVVQEALIEAYRKLDKYDESRPLKPWLFRIAHNRCIDFLRRKGVRDEAEAAAALPEAVSPSEPATLGIGKAVEHLVASLPPKERACILLKDVFDYSLDEIAELVDSTVGGVKAALNRGRTKLTSSPPSSPSVRSANPELAQIMQLYVDRFNVKTGTGVRELISADARLNVLDRFAGKFADAPCFFNYDRWPWPWKLALGESGWGIGAHCSPTRCRHMDVILGHSYEGYRPKHRANCGLHSLPVDDPGSHLDLVRWKSRDARLNP